jgi:BTB/POZ domain-containing protein KCTD9
MARHDRSTEMNQHESSSTKKKFNSKQSWIQRCPTWAFLMIFVVGLSALAVWLNNKDLLCGNDYQQLQCSSERELRPRKELAQSLVKILFDNAESISIVAAIALYFKEAPDRNKQSSYEAWRVIDQAAGLKVSYARIKALEDLNNAGISLQRIDLQGADLSGINLRKANLQGVNLEGANLAWANLEGTDMTSAHLQKSNFLGSNCCNADFGGADLSEAQLLKAKFDRANFSGSCLKDSLMHGSDFSNARFTFAILTNTKVGHFDLSAPLSNGVLTNLKLPQDTKLRILDPANFSNANFIGANLQGVNLQDANSEGAKFGNTSH